MARLPAVLLAVVPAIVAFATGCGRPATESDCQLIVDKNIEVALDPGLDAKTRTEKLDGYKKQLEAEVKACVGKRGTESYLKCVKAAKTEADIRDCGK